MKSLLSVAVLTLSFSTLAQEIKPMETKLNESKKAQFFCKFKASKTSDLVSAKLILI